MGQADVQHLGTCRRMLRLLALRPPDLRGYPRVRAAEAAAAVNPAEDQVEAVVPVAPAALAPVAVTVATPAAVATAAEEATTCRSVLHSMRMAPLMYGFDRLLEFNWKYPAMRLRACGSTR